MLESDRNEKERRNVKIRKRNNVEIDTGREERGEGPTGRECRWKGDWGQCLRHDEEKKKDACETSHFPSSFHFQERTFLLTSSRV